MDLSIQGQRLAWTGMSAAVVVAAFAALATPAAALNDGGTSVATDSQGYNGRSKRSSAGYSGAPEVATSKRQRAKAASIAGVDDEAVAKPRTRRTRVASLRSSDDGDSGYSSRPKVSGGHVSWAASGGCLPGSLRSVISEVSQYGSVTVSSTGRSHSHNRSVGGASGSYHLSCQAADFRVHGNVASAASFLRNHGSVGGFHHYGGGLFHIDTGPKRTW